MGLDNAEYNIGQGVSKQAPFGTEGRTQGLNEQAQTQLGEPPTPKTNELPESKGVEETEAERLKPYQEELNSIANGLEQLSQPLTAPVQGLEASVKDLQSKNLLTKFQGVVNGVISAGMVSPAGLVFNSAISLAEMVGTPTGKLMNPIELTDAPTTETGKAFVSLLNLGLVGAELHKIGKPFSDYKEVAKNEPEKLQSAIDDVKQNATPEELQSTLTHLENPEGAKLQTKSLELEKDLGNPNISPDVKPILEVGKQEVDQNLLNQTKEFTDKTIDNEEKKQAVEKVQSAIDNATTPSAKEFLKAQLEKLAPPKPETSTALGEQSNLNNNEQVQQISEQTVPSEGDNQSEGTRLQNRGEEVRSENNGGKSESGKEKGLTDATQEGKVEEIVQSERANGNESGKKTIPSIGNRIFSSKEGEKKINADLSESSINSFTGGSSDNIVLSLLHEQKILDAVIPSIPIDVMDNFRREQIPSNKVSHDFPMLLDRLISNGKGDIAKSVSASLTKSIADLRATS